MKVEMSGCGQWPEKHYKDNISMAGKILWIFGACRFYKDGDCTSMYFRFWHPLYWLLLFILMPICAVAGAPIFDELPWRVKPWFKENKIQVEFISPF